MNDPHLHWYHNGTLPHFDAAHITQAITFRLADSLPLAVLERMDREVDSVTDEQQRRRERHRRIDALMDRGFGSCILRRPDVAAILADTLRHDHGRRCTFDAWVIMPNHVHVLVRQHEGFPLAKLVQSWKVISAKRVAALIGADGARWQRDYWDHFVRDPEHHRACLDYIHANPVKAGFVRLASEWRWSSAATLDVDVGIDAPSDVRCPQGRVEETVALYDRHLDVDVGIDPPFEAAVLYDRQFDVDLEVMV